MTQFLIRRIFWAIFLFVVATMVTLGACKAEPAAEPVGYAELSSAYIDYDAKPETGRSRYWVAVASFLEEPVIPYESDEVTRLIVDSHDRAAFGEIAHLTVGGLRDWLLSDASTTDVLATLAPGITPDASTLRTKMSA